MQWSLSLLFSDTEDSEVHVSSVRQNSQHEIIKPRDVQELVSEENLLVRNIKLRKQLDELDISQLLQLLEQTIELEKGQDVADVQNQLIESIARIDPEVALERIWKFKFDRWNNLVSSVFTEWTSLNPDQALQTAATLMGSPRRTAIKTILDTVSDTAAVLKIAESWMKSDIEATFHWLASSVEIEVYRILLLRSFLEKMTVKDADRAFDLALSLPIREDEDVGLEAIVIEQLINFDTDRALLLLSRVRPGNTQLATYASVAGILVSRHKTDKAIELGKQLPETLQARYYDNIAVSIATGVSPTKILEVLPHIPTKKGRSKVAEFVLLFHSAADEENKLSDEYVEAMLEHVVPANLERVRFLLQP